MSFSGINLGFLPGGQPVSRAVNCSADGSVVVGAGEDSDGNAVPVYWDASNTIHELPIPAGAIVGVGAQASACSSDGTVIVGTTGVSDTVVPVAVVWTGGPSWTATPLPILPPFVPQGNYTLAYDCSSDGSVVCGQVSNTNPAISLPSVWVSGVLALLPMPGGALEGVAFGCSADGTTIVGFADDITTTGYVLRWTGGPSWSFTILGTLPGAAVGTGALASACSSDASIIVGNALDSASSLNAVFWNPTTPTLLTGPLGGPGSSAWGCDATGALICGVDISGIASVWASNIGANLPLFAGAQSVNLASGVSADASTVVGWGVDAGSNQTAVKWTAGVVRIASIADLVLRPSNDFFDLSVLTNRRKLIDDSGCTVNLGSDGSTPFGSSPAIFFTIPQGGLDPDAFATNFGSGGLFTLSGGDLAFAGTQPCCSHTTIHFDQDLPSPANPQVMLSVSDDGGRTWSPLQKWRSMGRIGKYLTRLRWLKMGQFRQRIIKLEITDPVRRNIVGIYEDVSEGME